MENNKARAEIIAKGLVQGVGFRYFAYINASKLNLKGFVKNEMNGTVLTVAEGNKANIEALFNLLKTGPLYADVRDIKIAWTAYSAEFTTFEIRRY